MLAFLVLTCVSFALLGFIIGIWAGNFEQLQLVPLLVVTPLVFLGGAFYSISMLPPFWQAVSMFNPVVYLISGFRWSFFGTADVPIAWSLLAIGIFTGLCLLRLAGSSRPAGGSGNKAASENSCRRRLVCDGWPFYMEPHETLDTLCQIAPDRRRDPPVGDDRSLGSRGTLNDANLAPLLERAFSKGKPAAVALEINSPGGSPVQSSLIGARIRRLAEEKEVPVIAFVEDVAASGGYWLAAAADEIYADESSVDRLDRGDLRVLRRA